MNEADVFLERRSLDRSRLIATSFRKLEYFEDILFVTINLTAKFDEAILYLAHLLLKYNDLDPVARRSIFFHSFAPVDSSMVTLEV